jgi:hypothetical protein
MTTEALAITTFHSENDNAPRPQTTTWPRLVQSLVTHRVQDRKGGRLWSPAVYPDGATRAKDSVLQVECAAFDIDDGTDPATLAYWLGDLEYVVSSTHNHRPERPKVRVVIQLSEPIPNSEFDETWRSINHHILHGHVDPSTKDSSRMFYVPSRPPDGPEPIEIHHRGKPLDWRVLPPLPKPQPLPKRTKAETDASDDQRRANRLVAKWESDLAIEPVGGRHHRLCQLGYAAGGLIANGLLERAAVEASLYAACESNGLVGDDGPVSVERTLVDVIEAGTAAPWVPDDLPDTATWRGRPQGHRIDRGQPPKERQPDTPGDVAHKGDSGVLTAGLVRLSDVQPECVQWLWPARIPLGKVSLLDGDPGLGKSLMTLDLTARATTGRAMPDGTGSDLSAPTDVVLLTAEDGLGDMVRPRLEAAGADLHRVHALTWIDDHTEKRMPTLADVDALESVIQQTGARLVIVDPLMAFLPGEVNSYRDQDVRRLLAPLAALAERTGAAVVVVRHLTKAIGNNPIYRGGGSIGIIGAVRSALLVAKDPDDVDGRRRILASTKCNLAEEPSALAYHLESVIDAPVPHIVWEGATGHTAAVLLAPTTDEVERSAGQEAISVLVDILADGPVSASEARKLARAAGVSDRTLDRAKAALRVKASRRGGLGAAGEWVWSLPLSTPTPRAPLNSDEPKSAKDAIYRNTALLASSGALSNGRAHCRTCGRAWHSQPDLVCFDPQPVAVA